ncbi:MAG: hypothetical protein ACTHN2_10405 [Nitrobacter sp.]
MAVADTRIVRSVGNVLTEHGPKILPITVVCKQPSDSGFFNREVHRADIGFAYSGSTLSGLAAQALSTTLLSRLVGAPRTPPPSLSEVAYFVAGAASEYMREVCQLSHRDGLFSSVVFGWCPEQHALRVFELTPVYDQNPLTVNVQERTLAPIKLNGTAAQSTVVIGTEPSLLRNAIDEQLADARRRGEKNEIVAFDAPKRALQKLIVERANDMVGGSIQQAWATSEGFQIVSNMEPIVPRPPSTRNAGLFILGFDTLDVRNVGYYQVGGDGR